MPGESDDIAELLRSEIERLFEGMNPLHRQILEMRFGLSGAEPMSIDEVALALSRPAEEVRRVETQAMDLLRHPGRNDD